jgi:uncharacterized membrane protein
VAERRGRERRFISLLLRAGLGIGVAVIAVGVGLAVAEGRLAARAVRLGDVLPQLTAGRPAAVMAVGLAVLILTPVLRVVALVAGFAYARDWRFATVAAGVAAVLAAGILIGRA